MHLTHRNLTLRNAEAADAPTLCRWWNDGAVMAHAGFPKGLGTTPQAVAQDLATDTDDTRRRLILEVNRTPIGEMSYRNMGGGTAEIGIKICEAGHQEQGHGPLYLKMLITALFAKGYKTISLDTNLQNTRAQHVYEKLGFTRLRVNHNAWKDQLGAPQSSVDYALQQEQFTPIELVYGGSQP